MSHKNVFKEESVLKKIPAPVCYSAKSFGFDLDGDGSGVKIAIIDTGLPDHLSLPCIKDSVNLADGVSITDILGQATIIGGLIGASDPNAITGVAPGAELYFAKICDDDGRVSVESFIASILWSVIKGVDIIALSMTTETDYDAFHDTILKAAACGICIVAPAGLPDVKTYPAAYDEVLSIGCLDQNDTLHCSSLGAINIVGTSLCSTYVKQTYCVSSSAANSVAIAAGLCALILAKDKVDKQIEPINIYKRLIQLQGKKQ